jgi:hypothetical protein
VGNKGIFRYGVLKINDCVKMLFSRARVCMLCGVYFFPVGYAEPACAYTITITPGARSLYLQVGAGTYTGGNYNAGGQPANNSTINVVSVTVPVSSIGNGTPQPMTSNSATSISFIDGFALCSPPSQVYIGGWSRPGAGTGVATMTVTTPVSLTSGANSIPFSQISWVSSGNGDTALAIPSGTFAGGTQTLTTLAANTWKEECMTFSYANTVIPAAGTYAGRAVYTLSLP